MLHRYINQINQRSWSEKMTQMWNQPVSVHKIEKGIIYYRILGLIGEGTIRKESVQTEWRSYERGKLKAQRERTNNPIGI